MDLSLLAFSCESSLGEGYCSSGVTVK